jgi:hypothetical protein
MAYSDVTMQASGSAATKWRLACAVLVWIALPGLTPPPLPKIKIAPAGRTFITEKGRPFVPFGLNYFRPGTGWAPQVWKQFDAQATRNDFQRLKSLGVNCVRVFLSYGSFYQEPDKLSEEGLAKFDEFLKIAEAAGIYVHPTGPDHWEGVPPWVSGDRIADETLLASLESFWKLLANRYAGQNVIFAYDLRNEPEVPWDTPALKKKWNDWAAKKYGAAAQAAAAWEKPGEQVQFGNLPIPESKEAPGNKLLLDYQWFREFIADEWTRRQVAAIKSADPKALVTVGFIQWSVPSLLPAVRHYAAFRPERQARWLDFMEIHFYPLSRGAYEYRTQEDEDRNLAYLESVVRPVASTGKPVVVAEFGWYGGGQPKFDGGRHPAATEEQQARWCRRLVEVTTGLAAGWLNWGFYDHPEARDVTELTGLLGADGHLKAWGQEFQRLAGQLDGKYIPPAKLGPRPDLNWDLLITSPAAGNKYREDYYQAFISSAKK